MKLTHAIATNLAEILGGIRINRINDKQAKALEKEMNEKGSLK